MGRVHAAAARRAGAQLTVVASSSRGRAEAVARELGVARVEDDAAGVFAASDVDVVHICTPNATHAPLAAAALAAGKHVVCEKPLATSVADARALARAAERRRRRGGGAVRLPLPPDGPRGPCARRLGTDRHPAHARRLVPAGLDAAAERRRLAGGCRAGGPSRAFADIGSHLCDLVEFVAGERHHAPGRAHPPGVRRAGRPERRRTRTSPRCSSRPSPARSARCSCSQMAPGPQERARHRAARHPAESSASIRSARKSCGSAPARAPG